MNGWFTLLNFIAWFYLIIIAFIVQMQVFGQLHARFHVVLISYMIPYPVFVLAVGFQQRLKYFYVLAILWLAVSALNIYFNFTFISVLCSCSDYEMCSKDQITYVWYAGLFLSLSFLDLVILIVYIRVIPTVWKAEQYINREDMLRYVRRLAYFTGQSHPHHIEDVHDHHHGTLRKRNVLIGEEQQQQQERSYDMPTQDVIVHTTHHTLKAVTLRLPIQ